MTIKDIIGLILLFAGLFVFIICTIGLFRFKYVLDEMHASALGDTMGIFLTVIGVILLSDTFIHVLKLLAVVGFIWLTSPIATHLIGKTELLTYSNVDEFVRRNDDDS
ncbi:MAG: monovalent cation/H(+) antiporter subunit G [Clostridia bacterium]|jgi:multicomponent Na+:H+ antiporter subunit G|nr:monovalent cation/H(+) antiporter subunit G [Clostridia bacterium]MCI1958298.1 monovalent cation/H(+) antiporter subunit G [Clostridia bacterium]MCI2000048.1 monovalent cation/H(+) antiporter subunit G [Clostridia bacterium]MCI2014418.1 monovalent cation/H(+) antiporter subunit G [Clostridia bacterium]